jgi:hypothetical protein
MATIREDMDELRKKISLGIESGFYELNGVSGIHFPVFQRKSVADRIPPRYLYAARLVVSQDDILKSRFDMNNELAVHLLAIQKLLGDDEVLTIHRIADIQNLTNESQRTYARY